ncbi:hypothetical protein [uncultured Dokdonia sp.]|uniref:hypothetical protein n=1 Tax=uncultured Dokdonia sp. TaxID=575653 RepID=UPI0026302E07|nr:hypothetical protein [uncultured Dokdonia sp.]
MRELPKDIIDEMKIRFGSDYYSAEKILNEYLNKNEYLDSDRIIRCVLFLTTNGIENFEKNLTLAKTDPRDAMLWAEYENEKQPKRVRDFNRTFTENGI